MVWRWLSWALLVGFAAAAAIPQSKARFDGYRVYRMMPTTEEQVQFLRGMEKDYNNYNFWTPPVLNTTVDIMVSPYLRIDFRDVARSAGLDAQIFIQDVQTLIDGENPKLRSSQYGWTAYYPLADTYEWLNSISTTFQDRVEIINIGKSYEGRDILGVKIAAKKEGSKAVFVESGIHAREWITVATATYLINELLTSDNADVRNIADNFDWYIVPSTNPDGYEFTHTTLRMWRKTRSRGKVCYGADPNRNWDIIWDDDRGSSASDCSDIYRGTAPFSEPETASLSEYLRNLGDNLLVYLSFHSYSQVLMIPYGVPEMVADNVAELTEIGRGAIKVLEKRHNTHYYFGPVHDTIGYEASGGSMDWVKSELKVRYTFEWELRDRGYYGFLLPATEIIPTAEETVDSIVYVLQEVQRREA